LKRSIPTTKTFTITEIAKTAIEQHKITSGDPTAVKDRIYRKIKRYVDDKYGKNTKITEEIKNDINSWDGLFTYFRDQGQRDYKGKTYYEALKDKMQKEYNEWVEEQSLSIFQESIFNETQKELDQEFELNKMIIIDKIMFKSYLFSDDNNYKEDYKITAQNNFSDEVLKYTKKILFSKYFDVNLFSNDFIHYFNRYEDPFNVKITPEMAESIEWLTKDDNYKEYIKN